jgi:hypothetical protein
VIIRGARNIQPDRIEALALRHDAIEKAAAFPVSDVRLGERVCLAVVLRGGMQLAPEAILEHLGASGLPRYDMPEFILRVSEMPLTANGKLLKRELVRKVAEGQLRPLPVRFRSASAARGQPMRAIVVDQFGPPERLRVSEVAEPLPGPDEILVRVQCRAGQLRRPSGPRRHIPVSPTASLHPRQGAGRRGRGARSRSDRFADRRPGAGNGRSGRLCRGGYRARRPVLPIAAVNVSYSAGCASPWG